jgi:hypothetical protein
MARRSVRGSPVHRRRKAEEVETDWVKSMKHDLPFIPDKALFKAVMFARSMMRKGTNPGLANYKAAQYYGFAKEEVAKYTGMAAARIKARRGAGL